MATNPELRVRLVANVAAFEAALTKLGEAFRAAAVPIAALAAAWLNSYPGMPYTAPSLWDADQMRAAR